MKKSIYSAVSLLAASFMITCCSDDSLINEPSLDIPQEEHLVTISHTPLELISKYVNFGATTRAGSDITIEPYVYDGDTVMYFVNSANRGWRIFSAKLQAPMILATSDSGTLSVSDTLSLPPAFRDELYALTERLHTAESYSSNVDQSWINSELAYSTLGGFPFNPIDSTAGTPTLPDFSEINPLVRDSNYYAPFLGEGYWQIDTIENVTVLNKVDHLIPVHWGQTGDYNAYVPYDPIDRTKHSAVGCVAVATAEYLQYLHLKDGIFPPAYSSANYDNINNKYLFSNPSTTIWDHLLDTDTYDATDSVALVLGYISSQICYDHSVNGTPGKMSSLSDFLRDSCGLNYSLASFNIDFILNSIQNYYPVIVTASRLKNGVRESHCFIIDGNYTKRTEVIEHIYWVGTLKSDISGGGDKYGSISLPLPCSYNNLISDTEESLIRMNWGWGESSYDNVWFNATGNWILNPNDLVYDRKSQMIKKNY